MLPKSSDFVYRNRDCLTLVVRQPPDSEKIQLIYIDFCFRDLDNISFIIIFE